jgi:3-isopropylmalate/(R)-2-methylmalate dehydratase small subunit
MRAVDVIEGRVSVLERADVDTDQIIPKQFLKRVERTGFGEFLFYDWLRAGEIELEPNPILVAGRNFGSGSSREHAVWALQDYGFQAVVSPSFADIFRTNCTKAGLLPVQVDAGVGEALLAAVEADPAVVVTIDVEARTVLSAAAGVSSTFPLDDFTRWRFLEGLDDIGLSLRHEDEIVAYEAARPAWLPSSAR